MTPVVMFGGDYGAIELAIARSLGRRGVPIVWLCPGGRAAARFSRYLRCVAAPRADRDPLGMLDALREYRGYGDTRPVLLPVTDCEVWFLAQHRLDLADWFRFDPGSYVPALQDKLHQFRIAELAGIAAPKTRAIASAEDVEAVAAGFTFPVFVKPRMGFLKQDGVKGRLFTTPAELRGVLGELVTIESQQLAQEYVAGSTGDLFEASVYRDRQGGILASSTTRKIREYPRTQGSGCLVETIDLPELVDRAARFLECAKYAGVANLDFKRDPATGEYHFLEVNTRHWGSESLTIAAGADFPWVHYQELAGWESDRTAVKAQPGVRWVNLGSDYLSMREAMGADELSWSDAIRSLAGVRSEAFFAWDDPLPFLAHKATLLGLKLPGCSGIASHLSASSAGGSAKAGNANPKRAADHVRF